LVAGDCGEARHHQLLARHQGAPALPAIPGVVFAGDYTDPEYPPTLEAAVRSGVRAADKITSKVAQ